MRSIRAINERLDITDGKEVLGKIAPAVLRYKAPFWVGKPNQAMLVIREEQLAVLRRALYDRFVFESCEHVRRYFPNRCQALGDAGTLEAVREGLRRGRSYGFESQFDLLRFLNLLFEFGTDFERNDANAWARPHLESNRSPAFRMDVLMEEAYRRLNPAQEAEQGDPPADPAEFDGIAWENTGVPPDYVPESVQPTHEPIVRPPQPGSMSGEEFAAKYKDKDEEELENATVISIEEDDEDAFEIAPEEEGNGRR